MNTWQQVKHLAPTRQQMEIIRKEARFFNITVTSGSIPATREEAAKLIYKFERQHNN